MKELILSYIRRYFPLNELISRDPVAPEAGPSAFNRFRVSKIKHYIVVALRISPWVCGVLLLFALALNPIASTQGVALSDPIDWLGGVVTYGWLQELLKTVSVGGLIGFGTNKIAITMLFRPVQKRPIWGQGMIPAQKDTIIDALARGMNRHILSPDLIRRRIEDSGLIKRLNRILFTGATGLMRDEALREEIKAYLFTNLRDYFQQPQVRADLREVIDEEVEKKAEGGFKKLVLSTYKRFNRDDYDALIDRIITDIPESTVDVIERFEGEIDRAIGYLESQERASEVYMTRFVINVLNRIDIKSLLARQMAHFDEARLEKMVWEATNEQLLYIQYLGTILGMLGGMLIWRDYMIIVYAVLIGILWGMDELLMRFKKAPQQDPVPAVNSTSVEPKGVTPPVQNEDLVGQGERT